MGNCLTNNQISAQEEKYEPPVEPVEQIMTSSSFKLAPAMPEESMKKKKMVRFRSQKENRGSRGNRSDSRSGSVRIRLVVNQEELQRILSYKNDTDEKTSLEQLLSAMKLRGSRVSRDGEDDEGISSWRPTLESIPEDRSMK